jgi:hypothetical protein
VPPGRVVKNGSKMRSRTSAGIPGPWSSIVILQTLDSVEV